MKKMFKAIFYMDNKVISVQLYNMLWYNVQDMHTKVVAYALNNGYDYKFE